MKTDEYKVMEFHWKNRIPIGCNIDPTRKERWVLWYMERLLATMSWLCLKLDRYGPHHGGLLFRTHLCLEELSEVLAALRQSDRRALADALADLLYVTHGIGITYWVSTQLAFDEIHRSNMTKDFKENTRRGYKGTSWEPPDLDKIIHDSDYHLECVYWDITEDDPVS